MIYQRTTSKISLLSAVLAVVLALLGTSCIDNIDIPVNGNAPIAFAPYCDMPTKAIDVTTDNLSSFVAQAFLHNTVADPYFTAETFTGSGSPKVFNSETPHYWPSSAALDIYAYTANGASVGQVTKTDYRTFTVTPDDDPDRQADFLFACNTNCTKAGTTGGAVPLNFRQTESKIRVKVKNSATNLKFEVSGWRVGFVDKDGVFTYNGNLTNPYDASTNGSGTLAAGMWTSNTGASADKTYTKTLASPVAVAANTGTAVTLAGEMILVPQTVSRATAYASSAADAAVNGSYIGLEIKIMNNDAAGVVVYPKVWAIWPVAINWAPGMQYTYTVDLAGGGYFETNTDDGNADLDPILEDAKIFFASVTVDTWSLQPEAPVPDPSNGHAYVDLGLRSGGNKILFATMNIGASAPQEYGDYFAWGETSKRYTSISGSSIIGGTFEESNPPFYSGSPYTYTKYNSTDNKQTLDATDDVASVMWGGEWRMPDKADLQYLTSSNCTCAWTADYNSSGISGYIVTGKGDYAGNSIFIPAAGYGSGNIIYSTGEYAFYWSRWRDVGSNAGYIGNMEGSFEFDAYGSREQGYSVRPVLVIPE